MIAPQSILGLFAQENRKQNRSFQYAIYFEITMSKVCFKIISFWSLESELRFDYRKTLHFDQACFTSVKWLFLECN